MTTEQLDEFLLSYTDSELQRQRDPNYVSQRYQHIARVPFRGREMYLFTFESVLKNSLVCAHKETRFASIPEHIHTVIEFLYVYAGHCTQIIGDRRVEMSAGDICLLDTNVPHSVEYLGKDDIIITLEMRKDYLTHGLLQQLGQKGIIAGFLANSISATSEHDQYLLFQHDEENAIRPIIQNILREFYDPTLCSSSVMDAYITLLYCQLMRQYRSQTLAPGGRNPWRIVEILDYIEQNYATVTLEKAATHFGFHPNYLSTYIRRETGHSFKELVITQRIYQAYSFLTTSPDTPVIEIAHKVGYENLGFFYQKFQQIYGMTPAQLRK